MQQRVPNPDEVAKLKVEGTDFQDFESVFVQLHFVEAFNYFRFTAVERQPNPKQFKIQQKCQVELGGEQAIEGVITIRQVAYDANSHAVQLQGKSLSWWASKSSIMNQPEKGFDGKTFEDIAKKVCEPFDIKPEFVSVSQKPYKKCQVEPGETVWSFLERIAREKAIVCGCDTKGNFKFVGKLESSKQGTLEEGKNILRMQYVASCETLHSDYQFNSSSSATDGHSGPDASEIRTKKKGTAKFNSPKLTNNEHPGYDEAETQDRTDYEYSWSEASVLHVIVTVQGWKSDGGGLWTPGKTVTVKSPMCPLNGVELAIETATFTQDNASGTLTVLQLVLPSLLKGQSDFQLE
jgi:prophage tail gpP-like protein